LGTVSVKQSADPGPVGGALGLLTGSLLGLLAGPVGVAVGAPAGGLTGLLFDLARSGIGADFVDEMAQALNPGKVALLAEVEETWVTPVDTRLGKLGGVVFRRRRSEVVEDQLAREAAALRAELKQMGEELAQASTETEAAAQKEIEAVRKRLEATEAQAKTNAEQAKSEMDVRINTLRDQMTQASDRQKARIEKCIAEVEAAYAVRSAKLAQVQLGEQAKELTLGMAVLCRDGKAGRLERLVGDPKTHEPAYLVVRRGPVSPRDIVVPVSLVADVSAEGLNLNTTTGALRDFPDYEVTVKKHVQPPTTEEWERIYPSVLLSPSLEVGMVTVRQRSVPEHMVDLRKDMIVYDPTGLKLGEIEGVIADAEKKQVTHLVMHVPNPFIEERRLVPVDLIDFVIRSDVYLRVLGDQVAGLPLYKPGQ
jgi:uncharacterized membrane protein